MTTVENSTQRLSSFRCSFCCHLLAKQRVRVYNVGDQSAPAKFKVEVGIQTKCRHCKKIREGTLTVEQ